MKNSFSSKIGVLLAAAGSAVGLGSIWKFPYIVGENGGGAFIILYIACSMIFGLPLVIVDDRRHQLAQGDGLQSVRRCQHAGHRLLIPVGAMGMALFTGWFVPKARYQGSRVGTFIYLFILRWLVPIALIIIFLNSLNII